MLMRDISQALPVTKSMVLTPSFTPIQNLLNHLCELSDLLVVSCQSVFRLDALALSVIATATWLAGWVAGWVAVCHSRYCIKTTKRI